MMSTVIMRANAIFGFLISSLSVLTLGLILSTYFLHTDPKVEIDTSRINLRLARDFSVHNKKNDLGILVFDLDIDTQTLFNWNVKQVFFYLTAEYESSTHETNQVVLWDSIVQRSKNIQNIRLRGQHTEYFFQDIGNGLVSNNITLQLYYSVNPNAGAIQQFKSLTSHTFTFPNTYVDARHR